jgi:hypothetical protein
MFTLAAGQDDCRGGKSSQLGHEENVLPTIGKATRRQREDAEGTKNFDKTLQRFLPIR